MRINLGVQIDLLRKMGNSFCQTMSSCNCFNPKVYDNDDDYVDLEPEYRKQFKPEVAHFEHYSLIEDKIFSITNESFNFDVLNDSKINIESSLLSTRQIYIDICSKEPINDTLSLDSGFSSRNISPNHSTYPIEFIAPSFVSSVLNFEDSSCTMSNFYEFLISSQAVIFEASLATDSFPIMLRNKIFEWSKSSVERIKQTAMKYLFFKSLNQKCIQYAQNDKSETRTSKLISILKKPLSLFGILASGFSLLNKLSLKHNKQNDDREMLLEPSYSYSPLRQFLMRIYDINFF